jgi:hypothetical protein
MSGPWALIALGTTRGIGALVAMAAIAKRRRNRRRAEPVEPPAPRQLGERRIEMVAVDAATNARQQKSAHKSSQRRHMGARETRMN